MAALLGETRFNIVLSSGQPPLVGNSQLANQANFVSSIRGATQLSELRTCGAEIPRQMLALQGCDAPLLVTGAMFPELEMEESRYRAGWLVIQGNSGLETATIMKRFKRSFKLCPILLNQFVICFLQMH